MVGTKSANKMGNIKKDIFQSTTKITDNDGIDPSKNSVNDKYSEIKIKGKRDVGSYCQLCDFRPKVRRPDVLETHMRTHTGDKPFSCAICDFSTSSKYYLETHMRKHTGEKPFQCPTCQFSTSRKDMLKLHLSTHTNEKPFACTECSFKCARKTGLKQHWSFHCKFEHFRCSVCDYKCRKLTDWNNHRLTHPAVISCPKCDYMGRCIEDLEKHKKIIHTARRRKVTDKCICFKCGKPFSGKQALQKHILNICK